MRLTHQIGRLPAAARRAAPNTVVAPRESAVLAGDAMYALGGNAVDAAVAAALVAGVVEPTETTLGGSGFMLIGLPGGEVVSVEFGPLAPLAARPGMFTIDPHATASNVLGLAAVVGNANVDGPLASGVPRTLLGLIIAQERWGLLSRQQVLESAIRLATEGFRADPWFVLNALSDLDRLRADPTAAETFLKDGLPKGHRRQSFYGPSIDEADVVPQPLLARTLEAVAAEGPDTLVDGTVARSLLATAEEYGMLLSDVDLALARPDIGAPRRGRYREVEVCVPNAPGGGLTQLEILSIWERLAPSSPLDRHDPLRIRMLTLAMKHAFADRYHWLGDDRAIDVPIDELLSAEHAERVAEECRGGEVPTAFRDGSAPWAHFASTPLHGLRADAPRWRTAGANEPTSGTTHISAADRSGLFVSVTHTAANHFGSGVVCPRTGLLFDSAMAWFNALPGAANSIRPGARPLANMGPALLTRESGAFAALGASGGRRIIGGVAQVIIDLVDGDGHGDDGGSATGPLEVLQRPRIDASGPRTVLHEHLADSAAALTDLMPQIIPAGNDAFALDFSRVNLVARKGDGELESAIDPKAYGP